MSEPAPTAVAPAARQLSTRALVRCFVPCGLGVLFFLTPLVHDGIVTIGIGVIADALRSATAAWLPAVAAGLLLASAALAIVFTLLPAARSSGTFAELFRLRPLWLALRVTGGLFAAMTLWQWGPEWVWHANTGTVVLNDLAPVLLTFFLVAGLLLPLLTDYGLMEFIGTLLRKPFRVLFGLPGRAAIDATASWLGSATVGVLITAQQYRRGLYSAREAAVIATNFSIASIAFSLLIVGLLDLTHLFVPFYFTVVVAGLTAAVITPRLPPLSWKRDTYFTGDGQALQETVPEGVSVWRWGLIQAVDRAAVGPSPRKALQNGLGNVLDIFFGLLPLVMAIGTLALALAEFTPIFSWLSWPIVPLLEWLRLPEAEQAAPAMLVGFADMFLPAVLGSGIESELTRFVIACVALTQLVYMSEVGVLILKAGLPLNIGELFAIFLLRTAITLPVITVMAHWIVG